MMTRKRLLSMLDSYSNPTLIKEYLRSLIELEITPFEDESSLKELNLDYVTRDILRYNLIIKSIEAVTYDYNPRKTDLVITKGFDLDINLKEKYNTKLHNLINITFGENVNLTINDRQNISKLIEQKTKEKEDLEDYYYNNFYIYFGALDSDEDKAEIERIQRRIKLLDSEITELEYLSDVEDLEMLDSNIKNKLHIKETSNDVVSSNGVYEIQKINDYNKVKVYKKCIKR